jgi:hypothetical protein
MLIGQPAPPLDPPEHTMSTSTHPIPDRAALSGPVSGAAFLAGLAGALGTADVPYPRPGSDAETIRRFFSGNRGSARLSAGGQLVSAAMLGRFTVSVVRLAGGSGRHSRGLQTVAAAGGAIAAATLTASGLLTAALTTERSADDDRAVALHRRAFLAGGVAHGVGYGLLIGALGVAGDAPRVGSRGPVFGRCKLVGPSVLGRRARGRVHSGRPVLRAGGAERRGRPDGPRSSLRRPGGGHRSRRDPR